MRKTILAIDFVNVAFSSYYSKPLINSLGMNVNAIKGFFFKIKAAIDIFEPTYIVFAEDIPRSRTFRRKLFPPYKAQRKPTMPDVFAQFGYIRTLTSLLGFPVISQEPYEADDILGMLHAFGDENEFETIILSSDRDLYQLVSDRTSISSPRAEHEFVDREYILKNYGLLSTQWVDLKILQGDNSDNVPGVKGIGHTTALKLIQDYGSVENIYSHINEIRPSIRIKLERGKHDIPLMRELMTIVTDYTKIDLDENKLKRGDVYAADIMRIISDLELHSLEPLMWYELIPYTPKEV